jgi:multicomponent Na+:H+ antiporter subunit D
VRWIVSIGGAIRLDALQRLHRRLDRFLGQIYRHHGPQGILARTWPTGSMAFWTTLLLGAYLIAYYL